MFSHKHRRMGDVCIEYLDERPQGYMTESSVEKLVQINSKIMFVPITTRSISQYIRVQWPAECVPRYAITSNGGNLLVNGKPDEKWFLQSKAIVEPWGFEMNRMLECLEKTGLCHVQSIVDDMFLFGACQTPEVALRLRKQLTYDTDLVVESTGRKVYLFPPELNKGTALKRITDRLSASFVISAGDSEIDVPMLSAADLAIVPCGLNNKVNSKKICVHTGDKRFSDFVLEMVLSEIYINDRERDTM